MLEFIYAIPENIGWALVGATAMASVMMTIKLVETIVEAIKANLYDEEVEE